MCVLIVKFMRQGAPIETLLRSKLGDYLEEANLFGDQNFREKKRSFPHLEKYPWNPEKTEGFSTKIRIPRSVGQARGYDWNLMYVGSG